MSDNDDLKSQLERQKLTQELKELQKPWYKKPAYLTIIVTLTAAIIVALTKLGSDYFNEERLNLQSQFENEKHVTDSLSKKIVGLSRLLPIQQQLENEKRETARLRKEIEDLQKNDKRVRSFTRSLDRENQRLSQLEVSLEEKEKKIKDRNIDLLKAFDLSINATSLEMVYIQNYHVIEEFIKGFECAPYKVDYVNTFVKSYRKTLSKTRHSPQFIDSSKDFEKSCQHLTDSYEKLAKTKEFEKKLITNDPLKDQYIFDFILELKVDMTTARYELSFIQQEINLQIKELLATKID